jgi:hypothetical protein
VDERLKRLSGLGDRLLAFAAAADFEIFPPELTQALDHSDGLRGGRPPFAPVLMFKILVIQTANNLSDERTEFLINDRLSFMRFLDLGLSDRVPGARTIWLFREKLTRDGTIKPLFERFDAAPQNQFSIDRAFGLIRRWDASDAAAYEGARLRDGLFDKTNTASVVWADTAIARRPTRISSQRTASSAASTARSRRAADARDDAARQCAQVQGPLARRAHLRRGEGQDGPLHPHDRIARASMKIGMFNLVYNVRRLVFLHRLAAA